MFPYNPILEEQARYMKLHLSKADKMMEALLKEHFPSVSVEPKVPVDDYIIDFLFLEKKIAIEIDAGQQENTDAYVYHAERKERLESLGLTLVRVDEKDILNEKYEFVERLKKIINIHY